jgi:hypothetical protein
MSEQPPQASSEPNGPPQRPWQESPWLWFGLYAAMALVALLAVAPKYARRQGRLEQRYENRVRMEQQRLSPSTGMTAPTRMSEARAQTSLVPLALVLIGVLAVAAIVLWLRSQRHTERRAGPPGV